MLSGRGAEWRVALVGSDGTGPGRRPWPSRGTQHADFLLFCSFSWWANGLSIGKLWSNNPEETEFQLSAGFPGLAGLGSQTTQTQETKAHDQIALESFFLILKFP